MAPQGNAAKKTSWKGVLAVLVTPFDEDGRLDFSSLGDLIDVVSNDGAHGFVIAGSTGEFYAMSADERKGLFAFARERIAPTLPLIGGIASTSVKETLKLGEYARELGLDGVMALPPLYAIPNEREVIEYYKRMSAEVGLPILLYNNPRRTGVSLTPDLVNRLADVEHVVAIKDSSRDFVEFTRLLDRVRDRLGVFVGLESLLLPALVMGADGVIAMAVQAIGAPVVNLYNMARSADFGELQSLQHAVSAFYEVFQVGNIYSGLKEAMTRLGRPGGMPREPLLPLTEEEKRRVHQVLAKLGLVGH